MFRNKELEQMYEHALGRMHTLEDELDNLKNQFNELLELLGIEEEKYVAQRGSLGFLSLIEDTIETRLVKKETPMREKETFTGKAPKENKKRTKAERLAYSRGFHAGRRSKTK